MNGDDALLAVRSALDPIVVAASEHNPRAVEILTETLLCALDANLLTETEAQTAEELLGRIDPRPGKPSWILFCGWRRNWLRRRI